MPNLRMGGGGLPPLTPLVKNIIIINVLVVALQTVLGYQHIDLGDYLGLHYWMSPHFGWWQFFTYMFMHGSAYNLDETISHIFFNMFGLYMFGTILEQIWGAKKFFAFYIICGLGAALCHLLVSGVEFAMLHNAFARYQENPSLSEFGKFVSSSHMTNIPEFKNIYSFWSQHKDCSDCTTETVKIIQQYSTGLMNAPVVGASGSIFGILFAFGYLFPEMEFGIMFIPAPIKAKYVVGVYAIIELFMGLGHFENDNVAHFAHLGGMLFAFIILSIWKRSGNRNY